MYIDYHFQLKMMGNMTNVESDMFSSLSNYYEQEKGGKNMPNGKLIQKSVFGSQAGQTEHLRIIAQGKFAYLMRCASRYYDDNHR